MAVPTLSIVVPAFNEERLLPGTLTALREAVKAFEERGWEWELIVCDNRSTDRTAAIAQEHGARVVFEPVNQIGRARNTGASVARGDWLLFLDADSRPSRALMAAAADRVARGDVVFVGSTVRFDETLPRSTRPLVAIWNWLSRALRWMAGSFVLVEATAFREVGGFDLAFYAGEEVELSRRLKSVARRRGRRGVVLAQPGLVTSARRLTGAARGPTFRFFLRATLRPWSTPRNREACAMWYAPRREEGREAGSH